MNCTLYKGELYVCKLYLNKAVITFLKSLRNHPRLRTGSTVHLSTGHYVPRADRLACVLALWSEWMSNHNSHTQDKAHLFTGDNPTLPHSRGHSDVQIRITVSILIYLL